MIYRRKIPRHIRKEVFDLYDHKCALCSESDKRKMQIHHLDCNHDNNELDNLMLTCIFCHAYIFHPYKAEKMIEWWMNEFGNRIIP